MVEVALSLVPVFTLIALGAILRRLQLLKAEQWAGIERLTYWVLFPPLIFTSIVGGAFAGGEALLLAIGLMATVAVMTGLMFALKPVIPGTGAHFSSVFQAGIRWNGYVALGVISSLHGVPGVALSAVGFAALVPINNVLSVLVLSRYASEKPQPLNKVLLSLLGNPLIIAVAAAGIAVSLGVRPSEPIERTLQLLGDATISLGLICVGAALDFSAVKGARIALVTGSVLRLWVMPAVAATACILLGLRGMSLEVAVICAAAPVTTSAYILAKQMGGDAPLMANLIAGTTVASLLTLPAALIVVQALMR